MTYRIQALRPEMERLRDEEHKTLYEIADTLGLGVTTVRDNLIAIDNYQPQTRPAHGWTEEEDERLIAARNPVCDDDGNMIRQGLTGHELTALFPDREHGTVLNRLHVLRGQWKDGQKRVR